MKIVRILVVLALAFGAFGLTNSAKAGAFTYTTGIQVQNLEGTVANITVAYYDQTGTQVAAPTHTVPANGSVTYFPIESGDGFNGSVVISSDKQVASVVNILGSGSSTGGSGSASYVGTGTGSTTVLIPLLMKANAGFNTWFNVQNTGSADAVVNVAYSDSTTGGPVTIKPGASYTFDQAVESHATGWVGSAIVTSDQPVAAAVIEESTAVMFAYSGFASGVTSPVMPLINANNAGYITGVQIQNAGSASTDVTVSYTPVTGMGTACTETKTIPAQSSATFALAAFANTSAGENCADGARFVGSAKVTTNSAAQPLVAIVNQLKIGVNGEAYGSFDAAAAGETVVLPLIMDDNAGYFTGFNLQNVGAAATTVNCVFTDSSYTVSGTLQPGEALNNLQNGMGTVRYVGSAVCTAATGGQIVAVVNEIGASLTADQLLVYEGINP